MKHNIPQKPGRRRTGAADTPQGAPKARAEMPGDVIVSRFLKPRNMTQKQAAKALGIPLACFSALIGGRTRISAEYALRLSIFFGIPASFWMGLQSEYDLACLEPEIVKKISGEVSAGYPAR